MKSTVRNTSFLYFALLCIFFSVNSSPINPAYILGGGLILILFFHMLTHMKMQKFTLITILFSVSSLILQLIGMRMMPFYPEGPNYLTPVLFSYSILISTCVIESFKGISFKSRTVIYENIFNLAIFFLFIELITRIINYNSANVGFYSLKYSVLYFDSNFTGLVILALCSFSWYLKNFQGKDFKIQRRLLYLLLLVTFSRGAIAALIITRIGLANKNKIKMRSYIMITCAALIFGIMAYEYISKSESYVGFDGSFNSKFYIISKALSFYYTQSSLVHFFGIGLGNSSQFIGIFAHNIYVTLVLEMGIAGTILFLMYISYTVKLSNGHVMYVWIPVFIGGISLFSAFSPFIFIVTSLICCESDSDRGKKIEKHT
ncbi:hypothetical protein [Citrobacter sp. Marseille-Q6884]|uniref:hypothetical protein n=1 Tax=Citrobacter sp. Marseille-Q6884 TaxID=2956786 RepID=UPI0028CB4C4A|nr:hypothetical protein [Citrobacter sp. Marseille-Q6884]